MTKFKLFFEEALRLPYKSNSQDNPLHELQVQVLLIKYGFEYEYQPNGLQQSPDFRVTLDDGRTVDIECKSSKQTFPTYNGGLPKKGVVYIFSSKKYDETTIFFAEDVVLDDTRQWLEETIDALQETLDQRRTIKPEDPRGLDFYIRNMFVQNGTGKKDYFKHEQREICEQRVLNYNW